MAPHTSTAALLCISGCGDGKNYFALKTKSYTRQDPEAGQELETVRAGLT
jgi:hypothetical protein